MPIVRGYKMAFFKHNTPKQHGRKIYILIYLKKQLRVTIAVPAATIEGNDHRNDDYGDHDVDGGGGEEKS